jgi:arylsulfatase A-like enzyme
MSDPRPNILYILTDQQSGSAMSCAGNTDLDTPAMDELASRGVRFDQAYCSEPLCTPCRGSMFTGLMPHECGTVRNGVPIREELRSQELGVLLAREGYDCIYGGKWHVPEGAMPKDNDHGFRVVCGHNDNQLVDACNDVFTDHVQTPQAERRPFFLVASFDNPHNICEWARNMALPWGSIGQPPPVDECPNLPANFWPPAFEPEIVRVEQQAEWKIYPSVNYSQEDWRRLRWAYFRLVEKVDAQIGAVLEGLRRHGLEDDTLVIFSSDHGDGHGGHQWNQKSILYEEAARIPLIVAPPGGGQGRVDETHLASIGLDLFPTICDYADVAPPRGLPGRSLRPLVEDANVGRWRDSLVIETLFDAFGRGYQTRGRALRTQRYKYIVYEAGKNREQLFDLQEDPGEMVDLSVDARFSEVLNDHRRQLHERVVATQDYFHVPGYGDGHEWK